MLIYELGGIYYLLLRDPSGRVLSPASATNQLNQNEARCGDVERIKMEYIVPQNGMTTFVINKIKKRHTMEISAEPLDEQNDR